MPKNREIPYHKAREEAMISNKIFKGICSKGSTVWMKKVDGEVIFVRQITLQPLNNQDIEPRNKEDMWQGVVVS